MTLERIINEGVEIFDFEYPFYKEELRAKFEQDFKDYFLFEEICCVPVAKFKQRLKIKLNLVMPYWNRMYETQELEQRILDNYSVVEKFERLSSSNATGTSNSTNKNLFKDAPKTKIDIDKLDVVNSISKDEGITTSTNNGTGNENWTRTMEGNIGIQTDCDSIVKYWESLRKVTEELFEKELSELFMGVY
jgi:hypothetical protein